MDKNTLIGFLLIGVVLFAFSWFNRPTPEQLEAQRRYQDSIAKITRPCKMTWSSCVSAIRADVFVTHA